VTKRNAPDPGVGAPKKRPAYNTETVEEALARVRAMPTLIDELGVEFLRRHAEEFDGRGPMCGYLPEYDVNRPAPAKKPRRKRPPAGS
jgi:hypothetical protein